MTSRPDDGLVCMDDAFRTKLSSRLDGSVLLPGDPTYDETRTIWNATFGPAGVRTVIQSDSRSAISQPVSSA